MLIKCRKILEIISVSATKYSNQLIAYVTYRFQSWIQSATRTSSAVFANGLGAQQTRGMATLKAISMRLKSVKNIQKITKSMKMVSAAKYVDANTSTITSKQKL